MELDARKIHTKLRKAYPDSKIELYYKTPIQLLVAALLSAQTTDKVVNQCTYKLFERFKSAHDYAHALPNEIQTMIKKAGFQRVKTKNIIESCKIIIKKHKGKVPMNMKDLLELPGVARKTANCVLWGAFKKNEGFVVDTHVGRVARRLKISPEHDPVKVEIALMDLFPERSWGQVGTLMVWHGRYTCTAKKPKCLECPLRDVCPSFGKFVK
jgi:endonuclease III